MTVAALYVEADGVYANLPDVEVWDEARDARLYAGPWPVVAHPPCGTWSRNLCFVNQARWGKKVGDDGGCFEAALHAVRTFGGVLEHPAFSVAWERFNLPRPGTHGWTQSMFDDGFSIEVSQVAYGHKARKRTWLYAQGCDLPTLDARQPLAETVIGGNIHIGATHGKPRIADADAIRTPTAFRDALLAMARTAR